MKKVFEKSTFVIVLPTNCSTEAKALLFNFLTQLGIDRLDTNGGQKYLLTTAIKSILIRDGEYYGWSTKKHERWGVPFVYLDGSDGPRTITINGKDIEISHESYLKLADSLIHDG